VHDYVVVGAGSAGCVIAARLAEDADVSVLLIDAGPPDSAPEIHVPVGLEQLWHGRFDWGFLSEPEPGLGGERLYLPRGRVLGGSSSLNAMLYVRGNPIDYDGWAAMGLTGWGYDDVLPYFKKAEDNERGASFYHGSGGPLSVSARATVSRRRRSRPPRRPASSATRTTTESARRGSGGSRSPSETAAAAAQHWPTSRAPDRTSRC
jgi:choline dehydrogenase-like flavoprotein